MYYRNIIFYSSLDLNSNISKCFVYTMLILTILEFFLFMQELITIFFYLPSPIYYVFENLKSNHLPNILKNHHKPPTHLNFKFQNSSSTNCYNSFKIQILIYDKSNNIFLNWNLFWIFFFKEIFAYNWNVQQITLIDDL